MTLEGERKLRRIRFNGRERKMGRKGNGGRLG
jgi:hypothetical protein